MGLVTFTFDPEHTSEFVRFPYRLYRDDAGWVPPLETAVRAQLDRGAEFFRQPGNAHRHFIARLGSRTLGRVTASINAGLKDESGAAIGCLGYFEAEPDHAVAADLIGAAVHWLRDQRARRIWGPIDLDVWHGYRMMTAGFAERRFLGEPYNPPYYAELFERCGFGVRQRWHSYEVPAATTYESYGRLGCARARALRGLGYRFVPFVRARFGAELRKLHDLLLRSYGHFLGFTPISAREFERIARPLRYALLPAAALFVHDEHDQPCGFAIAPLDLADAQRAMRGRDSLPSRLRFLRARHRTRRAFLHMVGLVPEEAQRGSGLGAALIAQVLEAVRAQGRAARLAALVAEGSPSRGHIERAGARATREYALYEARP